MNRSTASAARSDHATCCAGGEIAALMMIRTDGSALAMRAGSPSCGRRRLCRKDVLTPVALELLIECSPDRLVGSL